PGLSMQATVRILKGAFTESGASAEIAGPPGRKANPTQRLHGPRFEQYFELPEAGAVLRGRRSRERRRQSASPRRMRPTPRPLWQCCVRPALDPTMRTLGCCRCRGSRFWRSSVVIPYAPKSNECPELIATEHHGPDQFEYDACPTHLIRPPGVSRDYPFDAG